MPEARPESTVAALDGLALEELAMSNVPLPPMPIDEQTFVTRNADLLTAAVHDETVMMDIDSGHYYGLDDIGSEIWRRLEAPRRFGDLVDSLTADYDADRTIIAEDVRKLLAVMAEHDVVTLTQGS